MFTFIVLDGDADLPQHLLVYLADRRAQRPDGRRGVEVEDRHEIFMAEILLRFQPAAGHEGIGDADGGGGFELHLDVVLIVLLQKGTVNDVENVLPVIRPVFFRQTGGHIGQLLGQFFAAHTVVSLQHRHDRRGVFLVHRPQPWGIITTFNEELWYTTVDVVKVSLDGKMTFVFRDGSTVEVPME